MKSSLVPMTGALLACLVVAGHAGAAFSGTVTRSLCGSAGFPITFGFATTGGDPRCRMRYVALPPSPDGLITYATPVERRVSETPIQTTVRAFGAASTAQVCQQSWTSLMNGGFYQMTTEICTTGAIPTEQLLTSTMIMLAQRGAANTVVTASAGGEIRTVSWTYASNGT